MSERILVPLDGSDLSSQILWQVRRLLLEQGARVELYTVVVPFQESWRERQEDRPDREERHFDLRREDARRYLEGLQEKLVAEGAQVTTKVELGDPADMILRRVERTKPSLIAMATHGRSGPSRWLRGSVAQRVLRHCRSPLLLVNPTAVEEDDIQGIRFKTILLPLDGSVRSASIVPLVMDFARLFRSEVVLQRVWPHPQEESPKVIEERLSAELSPVCADFEQAGVKARTRIDYGHPAEVVLETVDAEGADLVAIATHGTTGVTRWFLGSVTEKVLRRCAQPLLVVNTGSDDDAAEG